MIQPSGVDRLIDNEETHKGDELIDEHVGQIQEYPLFALIECISRLVVKDAQCADIDRYVVAAVSQGSRGVELPVRTTSP